MHTETESNSTSSENSLETHGSIKKAFALHCQNNCVDHRRASLRRNFERWIFFMSYSCVSWKCPQGHVLSPGLNVILLFMPPNIAIIILRMMSVVGMDRLVHSCFSVFPLYISSSVCILKSHYEHLADFATARWLTALGGRQTGAEWKQCCCMQWLQGRMKNGACLHLWRQPITPGLGPWKGWVRMNVVLGPRKVSYLCPA